MSPPSRKHANIGHLRHANSTRLLCLHATTRLSRGRAVLRHRYQFACTCGDWRHAWRESLGSRPDDECLHAEPHRGAPPLRSRLRPVWSQTRRRVRYRAVCGREPRLRSRSVAAGAADLPLRPGHRRRQHGDDLCHYSRSVSSKRPRAPRLPVSWSPSTW